MDQISPKGGHSPREKEPTLHLPLTTDPPTPLNPPKPLVWLVSLTPTPRQTTNFNSIPNAKF
jgi:hypothetical protein